MKASEKQAAATNRLIELGLSAWISVDKEEHVFWINAEMMKNEN